MKIAFRYATLILVLGFLGICGCSKDAKKARVLAQADKDFAAERFENAEIGYLNLLRLSPVDPIAIRQLGIIYFTEGRLPEAFGYLEKAYELESENVEVQLKLAMTSLAFKRTKEARELAEKVLAKRPGDEDALLVLAESATSPTEIRETQQKIEQIRKQDKARSSYHLALGTLFLRQRETAKAEREFTSASSLDPNSGALHLAFGNLYWMQNELDKAEKSFQIASQTTPIRSSRRLKYAEFQMKNGRMEEAKQTLRKITEHAADYFPAWSYLIRITFEEKKFDDCAELVTKVLTRDPRNYDGLFYRAGLKLAKGEVSQAIEDFEQMAKFFERVPEVQFQLARAYLMSGDAVKGVRSLNRALGLDPNFSAAALLLSEVQLRTDPAAVVPRLLQIIKDQPQTLQAHLLLANAYLAQRKSDEALAVYREMATLFPKEPQPSTRMGMVLAQGGKPVEARKAFERSLEILPDYPPALEQLVDLDISEKKYSAAIDRMRGQLKKNPAAAEPWLLIGKIQMAQKNLTEAESSLQKCISLNPELRLAYILLAQLYVESNRHQEALSKLSTISAKTNEVTVLMQMGMIHDELKNYTVARDIYEKVLTANPNFSLALNNLAYLYSERLGEGEKAYDMAQKARQLLPYDPFTADTLGWILFKKGDYSRALGLLQESASKLSGLTEVQFHLGMTYYMLGDEKAARPILEKVLQSKDEFLGKEKIREPLAILAIDENDTSSAVLAMLEKRAKEEPRDVVALNRLATIHERTGAMDKAVKICETALKNSPLNAMFALKLSRLYSSHFKDQEKALEFAKQARKSAPDDPEIAHVLSRLVYKTGDHKWALSLAQEAALKRPGQADLLHDLAWSYYSVGQIAEAESAMQSALRLGNSSARFDDAKIFIAMLKAGENLAGAKEVGPQTQKILGADPDYVPALMCSALLREGEGNYKGAQQLYDRVLARYPLFMPATKRLAVLYADHLNSDQKAYELALKARTAFPDDADLAKTLGILAYRRGDYAKSAQFLKESARKRVEDADLMYFLGMAQFHLKDRTGSQTSLQQALDMNLPEKFAGEAKQRLAELKK